jgi:predicted XRE-type DNA-binding protein
VKALTATDILDFYRSRNTYLAIENGDYIHLGDDDIADGSPLSYSYVTTGQGAEAYVLLARDTIVEGDWFPDALDDDSNLRPEVAAEMADIINADAGFTLTMAVERAQEVATVAEQTARDAQAAALARAAAVARVVSLCGGNQSEAARRLGIDQSRVSRLAAKASTLKESLLAMSGSAASTHEAVLLFQSALRAPRVN